MVHFIKSVALIPAMTACISVLQLEISAIATIIDKCRLRPALLNDPKIRFPETPFASRYGMPRRVCSWTSTASADQNLRRLEHEVHGLKHGHTVADSQLDAAVERAQPHCLREVHSTSAMA
jgi:hypothetical protein